MVLEVIRIENYGLWHKVFVSKHELLNGFVNREGNRNLLWWRDIYSIEINGDGVEEIDLGENMSNKIGNGHNTLFWCQPWLDGVILKDSF